MYFDTHEPRITAEEAIAKADICCLLSDMNTGYAIYAGFVPRIQEATADRQSWVWCQLFGTIFFAGRVQGVTGKPSAFSGWAFFCFANCTACIYAWSYVIFVPFMASSILCSFARLSSTKVEPTSKNNHSIRLNIPILSFKPLFIFRKVHLQSTF